MRRVLIVTAAVVCSASTVAWGKGRSGSYKPPEVVVPAVDAKPAEQARTELTAARAERRKADDDLASVVARLKDDFEKSPAMAQAVSEVKAAQAAYDATVKPVLARARESDEYKAAAAAKSVTQTKIDALHREAGGESQVAELAQEAMRQSGALTAIENRAVAQDPSAAEAKKKLAVATAAAAKLRAQSNATLAENADWQAARKAVDAATDKLHTAEEADRAETAKLAAATAAHNAAQARKDNLDRTHPQLSTGTAKTGAAAAEK